MIYLITKMIVYLVAAGLIGLASGWLLRSIGVDKAIRQLEYSHQDKLDALIEQHQEELAEFAENAKQSRADLQRLEINNKALRETIGTNAKALELAQSEAVQLSAKLKASDAFNKEILQVTGHSIEEFDNTMEVREQTLDNSDIELSDSTLDDSMIGTQDKTMLESDNVVNSGASLNSDTGENLKPHDSDDSTKSATEDVAEDEPVEITMGNLWSHIGQVVGTKK